MNKLDKHIRKVSSCIASSFSCPCCGGKTKLHIKSGFERWKKEGRVCTVRCEVCHSQGHEFIITKDAVLLFSGNNA